MQKNIIITMLLALVIAIFAILNAATIPINLFFVQIHISAALIILGSAFIGAVIVLSLDAVSKYKKGKELKEAQKTIQKLSDENISLNESIKSLNAKEREQQKTEEDEYPFD